MDQNSVGLRSCRGPTEYSTLNPVIVYLSYNKTGIAFEIRLFADDCVCYRHIHFTEECEKLQKDMDRLGAWASINYLGASITTD